MILDDSELLFGDLAYEDRLVVFFDILGWQSHIAEAGQHLGRIARLAAAVRLFRSHMGVVGDKDARITTFSDNVVFSKRYAPGDVPWFLHGIATIVLGAATFGFLVRGGATRGNLFHDEQIVFGPALNRAYELESKKAFYPRVLIDDNLYEDLPKVSDYIAQEDDVFVDPYRPDFWNRVQHEHPIKPETVAAFNGLADTMVPLAPVILPGHFVLGAIAERLRREMMLVERPREWSKLAWLFDRIASRLGSSMHSGMIAKTSALQHALDQETSDSPQTGSKN